MIAVLADLQRRINDIAARVENRNESLERAAANWIQWWFDSRKQANPFVTPDAELSAQFENDMQALSFYLGASMAALQQLEATYGVSDDWISWLELAKQLVAETEATSLRNAIEVAEAEAVKLRDGVEVTEAEAAKLRDALGAAEAEATSLRDAAEAVAATRRTGADLTNSKYEKAREVVREIARDRWEKWRESTNEPCPSIKKVADDILRVIKIDPGALNLSEVPALSTVKKWIKNNPETPPEASAPGRRPSPT